MIGAIAGDIIGSVHEYLGTKTKHFPLLSPHCFFTDDSIMTISVAKAILGDGDYLKEVREMGRRYPDADYGGSFAGWLRSDDPQPYNSWGNGSAMRVSPVGFAFDTADTVLHEAARTAEITHNHPEGIKGAQATALAVFLGRTGRDKESMRAELMDRFGYDLKRTVDEIRPSYSFDVSCQGTVPEAIIAFLDSDSYEDAIRNAISLGGDGDTLACIAGGIAEAYYGPIPQAIREKVEQLLPDDMRQVVEAFCRRYGVRGPGARGGTRPMDSIAVEHNPTDARLSELGVFAWPIWEKEASEFPWHYDEREVCYLLEGYVVVTPDGGDPVEFGKGDLVTFPKGMNCTWLIRKDVRKHYRFG